jgi:hypothetical protein
MIQLPEGIDYTKYYSTSGMSTKHWGSAAWKFLFCSIIGQYPIRVNNENQEHIIIKDSFKNMFTGLSYVMPCVYCRDSFKGFLNELPMEEYLIGRIEMMYWLYLMKEKVNVKLRTQEQKCYVDEKKHLKAMFYSKQITEKEYYKKVSECKHDTFLTAPTPSFKEVLDTYESLRAVCSPKAKICALPKKKK